jgi:hypothetical protein
MEKQRMKKARGDLPSVQPRAFQMAPQTRRRIHAPTLVKRILASGRYADRRGM